LVEKIMHMMGSDLTPLVRNQASNEIRNQFLSAEKARTRLGWRPGYTLEQGLAYTIEWYRRTIEARSLGALAAATVG
jgi:CDP-glucose 4,6-dehydratase